MDEFSVLVAPVACYHFCSICRQVFSTVVGSPIGTIRALSNKGRPEAVRPPALAGPLSGGQNAS